MKEIKRDYKKHVLVCTNQREKYKACCANVNGIEIYEILKKYVLARKQYSDILIVEVDNDISLAEVESAKCLGECNNIGATISIYHLDKRSHEFYKEITQEDLGDIVKKIDPDYDDKLLQSIIGEVFTDGKEQ